MKYWAILLKDDGTEKLGTSGHLRGEYKSLRAFTTYQINRNATMGAKYNVYTYHDGIWTLRKASVTKATEYSRLSHYAT